jgi:hypothetical protein
VTLYFSTTGHTGNDWDRKSAASLITRSLFVYGCDIDCNVCGPGKSMSQSDRAVNVTTHYATGAYLCSEIEYAADSGFLSTSECTFLSDAIYEICGCASGGEETPNPPSSTTEESTENPLVLAIAMIGGVISGVMFL